MAYRLTPLITNEIYHIYNRGVEKRVIFTSEDEYAHFLDTLLYYQQVSPPTKFSLALANWKFEEPKLVEIISYCLMPNHFHLLIKQTYDKGISTYISRVINSYTRYFNTKNKRVGPLFQGSFKSKRLTTDEELIHLSRYIHLNPFVSRIENDLTTYAWSSLKEYINQKKSICSKEVVLNHFNSSQEYLNFIRDHADYARSLELVKDLALDS